MYKLKLIFVTILFYSQSLFGIDTLKIDHYTNEVELDEFAQYYGTDVDYIFPNFDSNNWSNKPHSMSFISNHKFEWFKIKIRNTCTHPVTKFVYFPYNFIEQIKFYVSENKGQVYYLDEVGVYSQGKKYGFYPISHHVKLDIPADSYIELYMEIHHNSKFLRASSLLLGESEFFENLNKENNYMWIWRGFYIFAIFIGLILFLIFQKRLYLYFVVVNIGIAFIMGANLGGYREFFGNLTSNTVTLLEVVGFFILNIIIPVYFNLSVPYKHQYKKSWLFLHILSLILLLLIVVELLKIRVCENFSLYVYLYALISFVVINFVILFLVFKYIKRGNSIYKLVFIVFTLFTLFFILDKFLPFLGIDVASVYSNKYLVVASFVSNIGFIAILIRNSYKIYRERESLTIQEHQFQKEIIYSTVNSQEFEKNNISKELHDIAGANLSIVKRLIQKEKEIFDRTDGILQNIRVLSHELALPEFEGREVADEIKHLCYIAHNDENQVKLFIGSWPNTLSAEKSILIYRVTQYLINISRKVNEASRVYLQLNHEEEYFFISYEDNGSQDVKRTEKGLEIYKNIENRIYLMDGSIEYHFSAKRGTSIMIAITL